MKIERYIVEIEMPDGDMASSTWVCDALQTDSDIEDEGRWKVSVKEYWKPSDEQMEALKTSFLYWKGVTKEVPCTERLESLYEQLKQF